MAEVLQTFTPLLERASVDEAYLDITDSVNARLEMCIKPEQLQNTHVVGFDSVADFLNEINCDRYLNDSNVKLAVGGVITEEIRAAVYSQTGKLKLIYSGYGIEITVFLFYFSFILQISLYVTIFSHIC